MEKFVLCKSCKAEGIKRPSACCPSGYPKAGDLVEFLSDTQTEKGPSVGRITISCGNQILVKHSDCSEEFHIEDLDIERVSKGYKDGSTLWIFS